MRSRLLGLFVLTILVTPVPAQEKADKSKGEGVSLDQATSEVFKRMGDTELKIFIFKPADHQPSDRRAAIVFFFGGGWKSGDPKQFANQSDYLAKRGMVAMTAEYRVASRHQAKVVDCVEDAKSAIRWVRTNADRLGIDPNRIAAGGGSAGGHLAACTGVVPGFENANESSDVSSKPNAMVLFNPAVVLAAIDGEETVPQAKYEELRTRVGDEPKKVSPVHHVHAKAPATIIFHGKADTTVPYRTVELFTQAMQKAGNRCELAGFDDKAHGFFNYGRSDRLSYDETVAAMDRFLVSLGYLPPPLSK